MRLLPPFERNPFGEQLDPRDKLTVVIPMICIDSYSETGVVLNIVTRRWLAENSPEYACRVVEDVWLVDELRRMSGPPGMVRRYRVVPFITFEDENEALMFKLRWF